MIKGSMEPFPLQVAPRLTTTSLFTAMFFLYYRWEHYSYNENLYNIVVPFAAGQHATMLFINAAIAAAAHFCFTSLREREVLCFLMSHQILVLPYQ